MFFKSSPGHNIDLRFSHHQGLLSHCQACLLCDGTFARPNGITILLCQTNSKRLCCRLIYLVCMRLIRTFVTSSGKQQKRLSHASIKITIFQVGMQSVNPSTQRSYSLPRETNQSSLDATALLAKIDRKPRD